MSDSSRLRQARRLAAPAWLSLLLMHAPVQAQIMLPGQDPPPDSSSSGGDDDHKNNSPFDSLDSNGSDGSNDFFDSGNGDGLLVGALISLAVGAAVYLSVNESQENRAERDAARSRTAEDVLMESAALRSPLTVQSLRPADSLEKLLTPDQRQSADIVTASTPSGEQLALTVSHDVARLTADDTLYVRKVEQGYQVTAGSQLVSFIPESRALKLTGHSPLATAQ